jgi:hypothetical protein
LNSGGIRIDDTYPCHSLVMRTRYIVVAGSIVGVPVGGGSVGSGVVVGVGGGNVGSGVAGGGCVGVLVGTLTNVSQ